MINLSELFERDGVECPSWLSHEIVYKYWLDSEYTHTGEGHLWRLQNSMVHLTISYNGEEYLYQGYDEDGLVLGGTRISSDGLYIRF